MTTDLSDITGWAYSFRSYGQAHGTWHTRSSGYTPQPGDAVIFDWESDDWDGDGKDDILGRNGDHLLMWRSTSSGSSFSFAPYRDFGTGNDTVSRYLSSTPS